MPAPHRQSLLKRREKLIATVLLLIRLNQYFASALATGVMIRSLW